MQKLGVFDAEACHNLTLPYPTHTALTFYSAVSCESLTNANNEKAAIPILNISHMKTVNRARGESAN